LRQREVLQGEGLQRALPEGEVLQGQVPERALLQGSEVLRPVRSGHLRPGEGVRPSEGMRSVRSGPLRSGEGLRSGQVRPLRSGLRAFLQREVPQGPLPEGKVLQGQGLQRALPEGKVLQGQVLQGEEVPRPEVLRSGVRSRLQRVRTGGWPDGGSRSGGPPGSYPRQVSHLV
jgi:hypothetical protein